MATLALAPDTSTHSDHDLVAGVRDGDDRAFAALYRRHYSHVTALVRSMVRDPARSEDIVQEAFLSALRRMRQTDSDIAFRAWISEIARNASIDHFRRSSRFRETSLDADTPLSPADAMRVGVAPGPDHTVIGRERFGHFRGALDELNPTHRKMIVLRELEGHSYREIGELMDLTPSGVESTLFRARRRLETEYDELHTGARCRTVQSTIRGLATGSGSRRDRARVHRHVRRCSLCARHARMLGVDVEPKGFARVAALLPIPALASRSGVLDWFRASAGPGQAAVPVAPSAFDHLGPIAQAVTVMVAALAIGQGPAAHAPAHRDAPSAELAPAPASSSGRPAPLAHSPARAAMRANHGTPPRAKAPRAVSRRPAASSPPVVRTRPVVPVRPSPPPVHVTPAPTSPASQPLARAEQGTAGGLEGLASDRVVVPGVSAPALRPSQVVGGIDRTVHGVATTAGTATAVVTGQ